jgi:hypothetical protein
MEFFPQASRLIEELLVIAAASPSHHRSTVTGSLHVIAISITRTLIPSVPSRSLCIGYRAYCNQGYYCQSNEHLFHGVPPFDLYLFLIISLEEDYEAAMKGL